MANRMLKDTIRTSKSVNNMSDFQFRLWIYLITYVDDYGRGSADPELLKGFVFPRRKGVTESSIKQALADLANSGSVTLYEVDGEPYFCFPNWSEHQRIQTKKSKFPAPNSGSSQKSTVGHGDSRWVTVTHGDSPPETETKIEVETETKELYCAERDKPAAALVAVLPLNDGSDYPITAEQVERWRQLYPAVDITQELRNMAGWLDANPTRRKTKAGIARFINGWLAKEQDKGGSVRPAQTRKPAATPAASATMADLERNRRIRELIERDAEA